MNNALEWIFRVKAQVAGIRAAVADLTRVQKALEGVRASSVRTAMPRLYLTGVGSVLTGLSAVEAGYRRLAGTAGWAVRQITSLPGLVTVGAVGLGAKMVLDAVTFRENTEVALKTILGSREAASQALDEAMRFASRTPFTTQQVMDAYTRLVVSQFKPVEVPVLLRAIGDLSVMKGFSQQAVDQIITAFSQIRSTGRLMKEELNQLSQVGAPQAKIYERIGAHLGKTAQEAQKLVESGRVSADLGIVAVLEAIRDTISGGRLGKLTEEFSATLTGLWSTLRSRSFEFLKDVQVGPLKNLLQNLVALTDTSSDLGKRFKARLESVIGAGVKSVFGPLAKATDPKALEPALTAWLDQLKGWARQLGPTLRSAWVQVREFMAGVRDAFAIMREAWGYLRPILAFVSALVRPLGDTGTQAAGAASGFTRLAGAALGLVAAWKLLNTLTLGLPNAFLRLGGALLKVGAVRLLPGLRPALVQVWGALRTSLPRALMGAWGVLRAFLPRILTGVGQFLRVGGVRLLLGLRLALTQAWGILRAFLPRILIGLGRLFMGLGPWGWLVSGAITAGYLIVQNWDRVKSWLKGAWGAMAGWGKAAWDGVAQATSGAWATVVSWFSTLTNRARSTWQGVLAAARGAWQGLRGTVGGVVSSIVDWFKGLPGRIVGALKGLGSQLVEAIKAEVARVPGGELVLRALTSITAGVRRVWEAGATVAGALAQGAKDVLQVRSPSRLFAHYGRMAMAGLALGATAMTPAVARVMEASMQRAVPEVVAPTVAPRVEAPVVAPQVEAPVVAPQVETPVVVPRVGAPVVVPEVATPTVVPRVEVPRVVPQVETPVVVPRVEAPVVAPEVATPTVVPRMEAPRVAPQVETPVVVPRVGAPVVAPRVKTPVVAPEVVTPTVAPRVATSVRPDLMASARPLALRMVTALPRVTPPTPTLPPIRMEGATLSAPQARAERSVVVNITVDGARDPKAVAREVVEALDEWAAGRIVVRGLEFLALEDGHA
jgi:tape measure domain-containing protein